MISFTVYGRAEPAGSKRGFAIPGRGVRIVDANPNAAEWKRVVAEAAGPMMQGLALLTGPVGAEMIFWRVRPASHYRTGRNAHLLRADAPIRPCTKPDLLKLARAVEDALTGTCYRDDCQIAEEALASWYGSPARVEIKLAELKERRPEEGVVGD